MAEACPSLDTLLHNCTSDTGSARVAEIDEHVEHCPRCQDALDRFAQAAWQGLHSRVGLVAPPDRRPEIPGYELECELGRGGAGVVYKALQTELGRRVAIKVLPSGPESGSRERESWLREARNLAHVPWHPGIVRLIHPGQYDGLLYLVMELVPGGSLKDRLEGPMPPRAAAALLEKVTRAVDHIHHAGVLHLDIKPSNILLDGPAEIPWPEMLPRLADFGIARIGTESGATQTTLSGAWGTPRYMAPEQISLNRGKIGPAADVYALGATLYHMLTGRPPFAGETVLDTLVLVQTRDPARPGDLVRGIPRDLETICLTCLNKDPNRRYRSALELADELRRFSEDLPIKARPVSPLERAGRWCRRRPAVAALLGLLTVTIVVGSPLLFVLWQRAEIARVAAEANHRATSLSRDELLNLTLKAYDVTQPPTHFTAFLETARTQELELRTKHPADLQLVRRLATIDRLLGFAYQRQNRLTEARTVLEESIALWDDLLGGGVDEEGRWEQMRSHLKLADLIPPLTKANLNLEAVDRWNARAIASASALSLTGTHLEVINDLSGIQRRFADQLARCGEIEAARRLLRANLRLLQSPPYSESNSPSVPLCKFLAWTALGEGPAHRELLRPAARAALGSGFTSEILDWTLAELTAWESGWRGGRALGPARETAAGQSPAAWADAVIGRLQARCQEIGRPADAAPRVLWKMHHFVVSLAAEQRAAGDLPQAQETADRLAALADGLTRRYPRQPEGCLVMSECWDQRAKNAYRLDDADVLPSLRRAFEAARDAVRIDPENIEARQVLDDRRTRLTQAGG